MAQNTGSMQQQQGLQQAASVIFALVAVVPMLIFAYTLYALDGLRYTLGQLALTVALAVSLFGFWLFRSMLARMSEIVDSLVRAIEQANRNRSAPPASARATPTLAAATAAGIVKESPFARGPDPHLGALGPIREFGEMARTMDQLWRREARACEGRRVRVSVANAVEPLFGVIAEVTDDGFYLQQEDQMVPVSYRRVRGIEVQHDAS